MEGESNFIKESNKITGIGRKYLDGVIKHSRYIES